MWSTIVDFTWTWSVYALVGAMAAVLPLTTMGLWNIVQRWLDRRYADDLPVGTGEFVRSIAPDYLGEDAPEVLCVPAKHPLAKTGDAFAPRYRTILLTEQTFFKRDPSFWAIGAHELGHAILHRRVPWFVMPVMVFRTLNTQVVGYAFTIMLVNMFFASQAVLNFALGLYWLAFGLSVFVCIDELLASFIAVRVLKADGRLRSNHWFGVYGALFTAFLTYVGSAVGSLVVVLLYGDVAARLLEAQSFTVAAPVEGFFGSVGPILAGLLLVVGVMTLVNLAGPASRFYPGVEAQNLEMKRVEAELDALETGTPEWNALHQSQGRGLLKIFIHAGRGVVEVLIVAVLMWVLWDQSNEVAWQVAAAAAVIRLQVLVGFLLMPFALVFGIALFLLLVPVGVLIFLLLRRIEKSLGDDARQLTPAKDDVAAQARYTTERLNTWKSQWGMEHRLKRLPELAHLPWMVVILMAAFA